MEILNALHQLYNQHSWTYLLSVNKTRKVFLDKETLHCTSLDGIALVRLYAKALATTLYNIYSAQLLHSIMVLADCV